jgi:GNAT superfamily N-acetyltransferase
MSELQYETVFNAPREVEDAIRDGLYRYNQSYVNPSVNAYERFAIAVKDDAGIIMGGLIGEMYWDYLHVDTLWLAEAYRGQDVGSRLLEMAEEVGRAKGMHHANLETTTFQARGFYEKHGYRVVGQLDGKPPGHIWYYMQKDL